MKQKNNNKNNKKNKLILGPSLTRLAQIWVPKIFCVGFTSFWAWFRPIGPEFGLPTFSSMIWLCKPLDIMVSFHHVQYQKK